MLKIAWEYILANLIALISLAISIYNLWKNRKNITVTYQENIEINFIDGIFVFDSNNEIETYKTTMTTKISIVNPSPNDIGFFDLRVFDPVTNINIPFLTYRTLPFTNKTVIRIVDYKNPKYYELDIPQRKFGVFKSNSYTQFDIVPILDDLPKAVGDLNELSIAFKISKRSFFKKDYFSVTNRRKFKFYGIKYDITGWREELQQLEAKQQSELEYLEKNK